MLRTQCDNHNVKTANHISMKFGVDIIFQTGSYLVIIQLYSPDGANTEEGTSQVETGANISRFFGHRRYTLSVFMTINTVP